jgi:NAD(P)-dependent dehydrogenase (short-subunit alcohol dehydrogenase family)
MAGRLEGKAAVIVGAGQTPGDMIGNGRAMALIFARQGANVFCVDKRLDSAKETAAMVEAEGGRARAHEADASSWSACAAMAEAAKAAFGRIDILVNNVGIGHGDARPHKIDEAAWDTILDVNLKSMVAAIRHVMPGMIEQASGAILNISSLAAVAGDHMVAYEVSKMAVNRLTTATALNGARFNVRCNGIMPGLIDTPMAIGGISARRGMDPEVLRAERSARVPMGRMGEAWDVANAALFLCSEEARYITGAILPVDGGMAARVG